MVEITRKSPDIIRIISGKGKDIEREKLNIYRGCECNYNWV